MGYFKGITNPWAPEGRGSVSPSGRAREGADAPMARGNEFFHPKTKEQIQEEALLQPFLQGDAGRAATSEFVCSSRSKSIKVTFVPRLEIQLTILILALLWMVGSEDCFSQSVQFELYQGNRLDELVKRNYLKDSMWVDSVIRIGSRRSPRVDTFEVVNGVWYQHFHGDRIVYFSKEYFENGRPSQRFADLDSIAYYGFLYYELVPMYKYGMMVDGSDLYVFKVNRISKNDRRTTETIYFDPKIGIVRYFGIMSHDVRLRRFQIEGHESQTYPWIYEQLPLD